MRVCLRFSKPFRQSGSSDRTEKRKKCYEKFVLAKGRDIKNRTLSTFKTSKMSHL